MRALLLFSLLLPLAACSDFTPAPKEAQYDAATNRVVPAGPCPDWSHPASYNYDNSVHSNFGCAVENNMAAQLANPADWARGHGNPSPDAEITSTVIQRYRDGEIPEPLVPQQGGWGGE